ncbi:MAG: pitrilysin family protein [Bacteroidetes bacterium]|nr:pitrilysin family protein [Bacteroidota bacterium]
MQKLKLTMAALVLSSAMLYAQTTTMTKPQNLPSNFHLTQLPNGLEVLTIEDKNVPIATIELVFKNGAFVQTPDLEGLAHLYEHMFFKANKDYPSQEAFLDRVNELGISFNGTTSNERVNYFVTLNKNKLDDGLKFMNSAARYPKFLEEEMKKENVVVAGEFERNESNPFFFLIQDMDRKLWGNEFARKNSIGRYEVILSATPEIMQRIKDRYYYPNNCMLVVAGDVSHLDIEKKAAAIFGDWEPAKFKIWEKYPIPEFNGLTQTTSFVTESEITQVPAVMYAWQGPDTRKDPKNTYVADVFSGILAQKNSKLQKAMVESGLAYQLQVAYQTEKYTGPINVIMIPNPENMKKAMDEMNKQISMWDSPDYFTDEQINTAKEMLEISDVYGKEKTSDYVHTVTYWWASASIDYYTGYTENVKKVTREDIVNYVKKYIKNRPHVEGVLISPTQRTLVGLDNLFRTANAIETYSIGFKTNDVDAAKDSALAQIAFWTKLNPSKKLKAHIYAAKDKDADEMFANLKKKLMTNGMLESQLEVEKHVKKEKDQTPAEKKKQNTATFSF